MIEKFPQGDQEQEISPEEERIISQYNSLLSDPAKFDEFFESTGQGAEMVWTKEQREVVATDLDSGFTFEVRVDRQGRFRVIPTNDPETMFMIPSNRLGAEFIKDLKRGFEVPMEDDGTMKSKGDGILRIGELIRTGVITKTSDGKLVQSKKGEVVMTDKGL
mgnify:FL=1